MTTTTSTRRTFMAAAAAGTVAGTAVAALPIAARSAESDAELIDLCRQYPVARQTSQAAYKAWDEAQVRWYETAPKMPAALTKTERDFDLGISRAKLDRLPYDELHVENLRAKPQRGPEAQARADEIVAAWDAWNDARVEAAEAAGLYDAEDARESTQEAYNDLFRRIAAMPATTHEGLLAKASVVLEELPKGEWNGLDEAFIASRMEADGCTEGVMALSIVRDLLQAQEV